MKKIIYIFGLILMTIALNSCQDWLDTESESVFTEESTFSNLEFASKAVFEFIKCLHLEIITVITSVYKD